MIKKIGDMTISELRKKCKLVNYKKSNVNVNIDDECAVCESCALGNSICICGLPLDEITDEVVNTEMDVEADINCSVDELDNELVVGRGELFCYEYGVQMIEPRIDNMTINVYKGVSKIC